MGPRVASVVSFWALLAACGGAAPPPADSPPTANAGSGPGSARDGGTTTNGRIPPPVIQRIVRESFGRFRTCYEDGLRRNRDLQGKVTVKFIIGTSGKVAMTADGGSDLPDQEVVRCIVRGFGDLSFPEPEGGMITVVYPIMFNPRP
jgi:hypothetical protein